MWYRRVFSTRLCFVDKIYVSICNYVLEDLAVVHLPYSPIVPNLVGKNNDSQRNPFPDSGTNINLGITQMPFQVNQFIAQLAVSCVALKTIRKYSVYKFGFRISILWNYFLYE